jgi:hypothetical protein
MARDEPLAVVALPEGEQGLAEFLHRGEVLHPEELFFNVAFVRIELGSRSSMGELRVIEKREA